MKRITKFTIIFIVLSIIWTWAIFFYLSINCNPLIDQWKIDYCLNETLNHTTIWFISMWVIRILYILSVIWIYKTIRSKYKS